MESLDRHGSGNLSAFITGAVVGAGVALLFAPQSGSRLLGLLRDYATRAKDELDDAVEHGREYVEKEKGSVRQASHQARGFTEAGNTIHDTKDEPASQYR
jgi:gas vesicle protein